MSEPTILVPSDKHLNNVGIKAIYNDTFGSYEQLEEIIIENAPVLETIDASAFAKLKKLKKIRVNKCKQLRRVIGTLLYNNSKLISLNLEDNALTEVPTLRMPEYQQDPIEEISFSYNQIQVLERRKFQHINAVNVILSHNRIKAVQDDVFAKCKFVKLDMSHNMELKQLPKDTFLNIDVLKKLDLSSTAISQLPTNGLKELETLVLESTYDLKKLPPILSFIALKKVQFTYAHHCCLFKHASREIVAIGQDYTENMRDIKSRVCGNYGQYERSHKRRHIDLSANPVTKRWQEFFDLFRNSEAEDQGDELIEVDDGLLEILPAFGDEDVGSTTYFNCTRNAVDKFYSSIQCSPLPDALNPCENVVGYQPLRYAIWFIWILAILGNIGVWIVLITLNQKRMRVHYFFMANLSTADLLTGVYLGLLAIEDVRTSNEYYNYAVEWQTGIGCQIAGFISVFASELSILSMFLIAFEMWYNVRYAFYGRRFKEYVAYIAMIFAYSFSLLVASLPLFGVSSYGGTSVCLPLTINTVTDKVFLIFGLVFNLFAFLSMVFCYASIVKMLLNPDQPSRPEDNAVIAKMALLIFTDMLCWFPTLFFGLTASLNVPLISISVAKIFLVFFYPINAFANPFLYVFFTKVVQNRFKPYLTNCLQRFSQTSVRERAYSSFLNFYHLHPPDSDRKLDEHQKLMQFTKRVHLDSSPRNSSVSTNQRTVTSILSAFLPRNSLIPKINSVHDDTSKSTETTDDTYYVTKNGKTFTVSNPRISTAPEMSDISENSVSEDQGLLRTSVEMPV
uniref:G_PROTEIN_RECEP_F1_2 domain-containing protein n=1 Tax=Syphacia muris TaxID=451379 RepID=A0A0N5AX70_9BILA